MRYLLFIPLLFTSCVQERLLVQSEYLTPERYASVWLDTPDPEKYLWRCSQRLLIEWDLPKSVKAEDAYILVEINFRNFTQETVTFNLDRRRGRVCYLFNEDKFSETGGMFSYRARLIACREVIAESCHQLYEEIIQLECDD